MLSGFDGCVCVYCSYVGDGSACGSKVGGVYSKFFVVVGVWGYFFCYGLYGVLGLFWVEWGYGVNCAVDLGVCGSDC